MKVKAAPLLALQARMSRLTVAVSGINVGVLCIVSMVLIRLAVPADPTEPGTWLADPANRRGVYFALHLVPFMGLAFLWFMAVLRHRIGTDAGRLESTVFLGSGLLFVGTLFAAAAITRGLMDTLVAERFHFTRDTYEIGRSVTYTLVTVFAIKMGAAFIFATSALARRAGILPTWLAYVGYAVGNVLLLVIKDFAWIELLFPGWVLLVSLYILLSDLRRGWRGESELSPGPTLDPTGPFHKANSGGSPWQGTMTNEVQQCRPRQLRIGLRPRSTTSPTSIRSRPATSATPLRRS